MITREIYGAGGWLKVTLACVVVLAISSGCQPARPDSFTAVYLESPLANTGEDVGDRAEFLKPGQSVLINDPVIANDLASFFPDIDRRRGSLVATWTNSPKVLKLTFKRKGLPEVAIYLKHSEWWGYEENQEVGEWPANENVSIYLRALLTNVDIKTAKPPAAGK